MKTFKVSFTIVLDDDASHPRKWIPETLWSSLRTASGEDITDYVFEEVGYVPNVVAEESPPVL